MPTTTITTPTFLDRFTVHLASKLLREVAPVERWLQETVLRSTTSSSNTRSPRRSLYWRSRLLVPEPPPLPPTPTIPPAKDDESLSFVDLTFTISINKNNDDDDDDPAETCANSSTPGSPPQVVVQLHMGYFWVSASRQNARYIRTEPLTQTQLEAHARSIGIDVFSGPPQAMAAMMAQALNTVGGTTTPSCRTQKSVVPTAKNTTLVDDSTLYYADVQERGTLELSVESISSLDTVAMNLLYFNLHMSSPNIDSIDTPTPAVNDVSDEVLIDRRIQECWDRLFTLSSTNGTSTTTTTTSITAPDSGLPLSTANNHATAGIKRPIVNNSKKAFVGVVDGTKKRKKKGKLVYAQPND